MSNLIGAITGAAIDRRDGDSGVKGAVLGVLAESAVRVAVPLIASAALVLALKFWLGQGEKKQGASG